MDNITKILLEYGQRLAGVEAKVSILMWVNMGAFGLVGADFVKRIIGKLSSGNGKTK